MEQSPIRVSYSFSEHEDPEALCRNSRVDEEEAIAASLEEVAAGGSRRHAKKRARQELASRSAQTVAVVPAYA